MEQNSESDRNNLTARALHGKMAKGTLWTLLEKAGSQGISFIVFAFIARLVGPEEYGLVSLCYIYLFLASAILNSMVDSIVTLHVSDDRKLSTLFWATLGCGCILSALSFAATGPFAAIMEQPRLIPLLRWFAAMPILLSLSMVPTALVIASMNFRIFAIRTFSATVSGGIVGIIMALKGFGGFAIVGQQIVQLIIVNIVVWQCSSYRPRWMFSSHDLAELLRPGVNMSGHSLLNFADQQVPRLLLGYFLGPEPVGYFAFITRIRLALQEVLVRPLSDVSYPAFAMLSDNVEEQKRIVSQLIGLTATIAFLAIAGITATAPIYVPLLFGQPWVPAVAALQVFLITSMSMPLLTLLLNLMRAHNRMRPYLKVQTTFIMISSAATALLASYGLLPVSCGLAAIAILSIPVYVALIARETGIVLWRELWRLLVPLVAAGLLVATLSLFDISAFTPSNGWIHLLASAIIGCCVYLGICFALQFRDMMSFIGFVKKFAHQNKPAPAQ